MGEQDDLEAYIAAGEEAYQNDWDRMQAELRDLRARVAQLEEVVKDPDCYWLKQYNVRELRERVAQQEKELAAARKTVELVDARNCCDGRDAGRTKECERLLRDYDAAVKP